MRKASKMKRLTFVSQLVQKRFALRSDPSGQADLSTDEGKYEILPPLALDDSALC